jgi:hypothetical protein
VTIKNTALWDLAILKFVNRYQRYGATDSFSIHFSAKQPSITPPLIHLCPEIDDGPFIRNIVKCSSLKVNRRFGGTCRLHLQRRRISQGEKQLYLPTWSVLISYLVYFFTLKIEWHFPPWRVCAFNGIHAVICQQIKLFINSAMRTAHCTWIVL